MLGRRKGKFFAHLNRRVRVNLSETRTLVGRFLAFDRHMNLVLSGVEEFRRLNRRDTADTAGKTVIEVEQKRDLGLVFVRGESVISVCADQNRRTAKKRAKRKLREPHAGRAAGGGGGAAGEDEAERMARRALAEKARGRLPGTGGAPLSLPGPLVGLPPLPPLPPGFSMPALPPGMLPPGMLPHATLPTGAAAEEPPAKRAKGARGDEPPAPPPPATRPPPPKEDS
eukprot:TRINITY_DN4221_c0_g1_i4.p1 TRINITY_DN4221_c0_g1~~TRINITY_DN4221_c0_g1_i4.p1  ORF type:complete len:253 (+),score=77.41 TRINITY_DN4221_c0_g1_i4:80-760(+)